MSQASSDARGPIVESGHPMPPQSFRESNGGGAAGARLRLGTPRPLTPFVVVAVVVASVLGFGAWASRADGKKQVHLTFLLVGDESHTECWGDGGYDDVHPGARVTVSDGSGRIIAVSELSAGRDTGSGCLYDAKVRVPDQPFYGFAVGRRAPFTVSRAELSDDRWRISLTLGA